MRISIIGTRGYPYVYSGYETFVKEWIDQNIISSEFRQDLVNYNELNFGNKELEDELKITYENKLKEEEQNRKDIDLKVREEEQKIKEEELIKKFSISCEFDFCGKILLFSKTGCSDFTILEEIFLSSLKSVGKFTFLGLSKVKWLTCFSNISRVTDPASTGLFSLIIFWSFM